MFFIIAICREMIQMSLTIFKNYKFIFRVFFSLDIFQLSRSFFHLFFFLVGDSKVKMVSRLAQRRIDKFDLCIYKKIDPFKVGFGTIENHNLGHPLLEWKPVKIFWMIFPFTSGPFYENPKDLGISSGENFCLFNFMWCSPKDFTFFLSQQISMFWVSFYQLHFFFPSSWKLLLFLSGYLIRLMWRNKGK